VRKIAAKLGIAFICVFLGLAAAVHFAAILGEMPGRFDALTGTRLFAVACQTIFYCLVLWFTLIRRPALRRAAGWRPRLVAAVGAYAIFGFGLLPPAHGLPLACQIAAAILLLLSTALRAIVLPCLGRSFSLMSEARGLVTGGPYRFVRHPLYLVEELAAIAVFIETMSLAAAALLAVQTAFQIRRILNEEAVLEESFPAYARYKAKTARLIPGVW